MPIFQISPRLLILVVIASCAVLAIRFNTGGSLARISSWAPAGRSISVALATGSQSAPASASGLVASLGPSGTSVPLSLAGPVGLNISAALDASSGALRDVMIAPGATWSFNAAVGDPGKVVVQTVGGVPGGGWCDLAARYVQAVRPLLAPDAIRFVNHVTTSGISLANVSTEDAVSIWNIDGQAGSSGSRQDLEITNTLAHPLHLQVNEQPDGSQLIVQATMMMGQ